MLPRPVTLDIDAAGAIRQIIGIMDDNGWPGAPLDEATRGLHLDTVLSHAWSTEEWDRMEGEERVLELELEDAAMLLGGLSFTEMMSVDLPWIDMVRWTVDFVTAELRPIWTDEEWGRLSRSDRS